MGLLSKVKVGHAIGVLAFALPAVTPVLTTAQEVAEFDAGVYRIDIAGRQRMLIQRMSKSVCFIHEHRDVEQHHAALVQDHILFKETLDILHNGGGEHDLEAEHNHRVLRVLDAVTEEWAPFDEAIEHVLEADVVSKETSDFIFDHNIEMLNDMNDAVSMIEQEYANPNTLNMAHAITLNIFGRQRMLSQRLAKDYCYILSGHSVAEELVDLEETVALFAVSLNAIRNGLPEMGITPPPNDEIATQLDLVVQIWEPLHAIFDKVTGGITPTEEDIAFVIDENMRLLAEMNKAVQMYGKL